MDYSRIDTTPGTRSPLSPPAGWSGDESDYRALMRGRYDKACWIKEAALASYRYPITVTGPYAAEAAEILRAIRRQSGFRMWEPYEIKAQTRKGAA